MPKPPEHAAISIADDSARAWIGQFTIASWGTSSQKAVQMSNTGIFNSDTLIFLTPANTDARFVMQDGMYAVVTSNGTVTLHIDNSQTAGACNFNFIAVRSSFSSVLV